MSDQVYGGATVRCSFGVAPSRLVVMPTPAAVADVLGGFPANILDNQAFLNVQTFVSCMSPANPAVASAMSAHGGAMVPMPCTPITPTPWVPGDPMKMVRGQPALTVNSVCMCAYGGQISVLTPR